MYHCTQINVRESRDEFLKPILVLMKLFILGKLLHFLEIWCPIKWFKLLYLLQEFWRADIIRDNNNNQET